MSFQDIRKSRKWLSVEEARLLGLLLFILVVLLIGNITLARILPGGEWLFLRWSGARAFLIEHIEPYSTTIAERVQNLAYGRGAFANEYGYVLNDPFYIVLLYTPLALFKDFTITRGIWMLISEVALAASVYLSFTLSEWQPPRWLTIVLFAYGLLGYFSLDALVTATPAILLALLYFYILFALRSSADELAGALLLLVAYQWEVGGLFFLFILFFVLANCRWNVLAGFAMSFFVMLVIAFLVNSGWVLPYLRGVLSDLYRSVNLNFGQILSAWLPDIRFSLGRIISILLTIVLFVEAAASVNNAHFRRVLWTACLALAFTPLMGLAIFPSNHVVLLLPLVLILTLAWERWKRLRVLAILFILAFALLVPFGIYLQSVEVYSPLYAQLLSAVPPIATILGLYWMRWWAIRPSRTWIDQVGFPR